MLGLLDQEKATLEGTIPMLQVLAALPLENPSIRNECMAMLKKLHQASFAPSKMQDARFDAASDVATSEGDDEVPDMAPSLVYEYDDAQPAARSKDSGRPKSLSLHHCKEFLLACANEIHELEDENPNFDYAEETSSEHTSKVKKMLKMRTMTLKQQKDMQPPSGMTMRMPTRHTEFDYASTADSSSSSIMTDLGMPFDNDQDDMEADQGSEFSEVLRRADYMSDFDDDDLGMLPSGKPNAIRTFGSIRDRVLCRQAIQQLQSSPLPRKMLSVSSSQNPRDLMLKHRVFNAFKQNGNQSPRNSTRKKLAFETMKTNLQQMRLKRTAMKALRIATRHSILTSTNRKTAIRLAPECSKVKTKDSRAAAMVVQSTDLSMPLFRGKTWMHPHLDLVLFVVVALFLQTMMA